MHTYSVHDRALLQSEWANLFIRYHKFWGGEPTADDLALIYTRKPRPPYRDVEHPDGSTEKVWCTFDYEQIDIDAFAPLGLAFIEDQLDTLTSKRAPLLSPPCLSLSPPATLSLAQWVPPARAVRHDL